MPQILEVSPPTHGPTAQELKLGRRASRQYGLFAPHLVKAALKQSFIMLRPDIQWKNPVMFVVEIGTVLTFIYTIAAFCGVPSLATKSYLIQLDIWLFLTVLFSNFASALAEARGKAQADTLRKTRQDTIAFRVLDTGNIEKTTSTALKQGDRVVIETG